MTDRDDVLVSTVATSVSQFPGEKSYDVIGDPILDRPVHNAHNWT